MHCRLRLDVKRDVFYRDEVGKPFLAEGWKVDVV